METIVIPDLTRNPGVRFPFRSWVLKRVQDDEGYAIPDLIFICSHGDRGNKAKKWNGWGDVILFQEPGIYSRQMALSDQIEANEFAFP